MQVEHARFPPLVRFLDDSSREKIVTGKCNLESLVTLEMMEKVGLINLKNTGNREGKRRMCSDPGRAVLGKRGEDLFAEAPEGKPVSVNEQKSQQTDFWL